MRNISHRDEVVLSVPRSCTLHETDDGDDNSCHVGLGWFVFDHVSRLADSAAGGNNDATNADDGRRYSTASSDYRWRGRRSCGAHHLRRRRGVRVSSIERKYGFFSAIIDLCLNRTQHTPQPTTKKNKTKQKTKKLVAYNKHTEDGVVADDVLMTDAKKRTKTALSSTLPSVDHNDVASRSYSSAGYISQDVEGFVQIGRLLIFVLRNVFA
jgi:hypothetical protein